MIQRAEAPAPRAVEMDQKDHLEGMRDTLRDPLTDPLQAKAAAQLHGDGGAAHVHQQVDQATQGGGGTLPHLDTIQSSFGSHDVSGTKAHTGGQASQAMDNIGALAVARGNDVAFKGSPSLHTAAHEVAHVVQQRSGKVNLASGVGSAGDKYEQHADAVADKVVKGESAEGLLNQYR